MTSIRLIPRLDVKGSHLIKGIHLEGLRKIGDPKEFASRYYEEGADELIYMDIVASLYKRDNLSDIVRYTAQEIFIPLTVGGGIRTLKDVEAMLNAGADKIAVNTAATQRPELIGEIARRFGSQCMVLSIEAKRNAAGAGWQAYRDNGREPTGLDVVEWAAQAEELGAGEILLTSVDQEGTRRGFDVALCRAVCDAVRIPVIISGGLGTPQHLVDVVMEGHAEAIAIADALHYGRHGLADLRATAREANIDIRLL